MCSNVKMLLGAQGIKFYPVHFLILSGTIGVVIQREEIFPS